MSKIGSQGGSLPMTVTFLEMKARPAALPPPQPKGKIALLRAERPPVHFYRYLYDAIGRDYYWVDRKKLDDERLEKILRGDNFELYVLYQDGSPAGMAELELRDGATTNLAYFGLMPETVGRRLGYFFLYQTAAIAWSRPISRLLGHTCTLDHVRALPLYQRLGFTPYARDERRIEVPPGIYP